MQIDFEVISEEKPGPLWLARFSQHWEGYKTWFIKNGLTERATVQQSERNLQEHMPEFLPVYRTICALAGDSEIASRFLSLYRPPAYIAGCSQLVNYHSGVPVLIRNYDYAPILFDGFILHSQWLDKSVIGMTDCLVGLLDGVNSDGLSLSLAFGGSRKVSRGFGIPLICRYVLETCDDVKQAKHALKRLPSHMAYNVTVLDQYGSAFTAQMKPGEENVILDNVFATNHQNPEPEWKSYSEATFTYEREAMLKTLLGDPSVMPNHAVSAFQRTPLYANRYKKGHGTLYTALYNPAARTMNLYWPDHQPLHLDLNQPFPQRHLVSFTDYSDDY